MESLVRFQVLAQHDPLSAIRALDAWLSDHSEDGGAWELLGILRYREGWLRQALIALEKATLLKPLQPVAQLAIAEGYLHDGCHQAAHAVYAHLAQTAELNSDRARKVMDGLSLTGDDLRALTVARRLAAMDPQCDEAVFVVAHYMMRCKYPAERIIPLVDRAVELAPETVHYRVTLALLYHQIGDEERANRFLSRLNLDELGQIPCDLSLRRLALLYAIEGDVLRRDTCLARAKALSTVAD